MVSIGDFIPSHVGLRPTVSIRAWLIRGARWAPLCTAEHDVPRLGAKCRTPTCEGIRRLLSIKATVKSVWINFVRDCIGFLAL